MYRVIYSDSRGSHSEIYYDYEEAKGKANRLKKKGWRVKVEVK